MLLSLKEIEISIKYYMELVIEISKYIFKQKIIFFFYRLEYK
jgi:hypothetical protein